MNKTEAAAIESQTKEKEKPVKRNREDKHRKKDDKSVDHVLKALSSLETTEEKLGAMCQKYAEMFNDHRMLQNAAKVAEKKNSILQKEKEQLQAEHSKAILTRSRLENLCRELQRQNKAVKEECMLKIREEEEKKREVAAKFQTTLTELGNLLAQNNDKNAKLRDDNLDMTTKLKNVCEQYEKKEQHVEKMAKQMHLEMQLANTKLAKAKMEMALEKEALLRDNQQLLLELKEYKKQLEEMKASEVALRSQIQLYNDKYDEFHKALIQSNDAIGSFKQEMERMAKQIRKLEKETVAWKLRYETTHRTLLQMTEEKIKSDETASVSERRLTALQGLCRSLQAQCSHLREVVKAQAAANGGGGGPSHVLSDVTVATTAMATSQQVSSVASSPQIVENNSQCVAPVNIIQPCETNETSVEIKDADLVQDEGNHNEEGVVVTTEENCSNTQLIVGVTDKNDIVNGTKLVESIEATICSEEISEKINTHIENGLVNEQTNNVDDHDGNCTCIIEQKETLNENTNEIINSTKIETTLPEQTQQETIENGISSCTLTESPPKVVHTTDVQTPDEVITVNEQTTIAGDDIALEKTEENGLQPTQIHQQQGKKNKGKRKKSGNTSLKSLN